MLFSAKCMLFSDSCLSEFSGGKQLFTAAILFHFFPSQDEYRPCANVVWCRDLLSSKENGPDIEDRPWPSKSVAFVGGQKIYIYKTQLWISNQSYFGGTFFDMFHNGGPCPINSFSFGLARNWLILSTQWPRSILLPLNFFLEKAIIKCMRDEIIWSVLCAVMLWNCFEQPPIPVYLSYELSSRQNLAQNSR